jgi:hypothetical protein
MDYALILNVLYIREVVPTSSVCPGAVLLIATILMPQQEARKSVQS